jgi:hypothetical protein
MFQSYDDDGVANNDTTVLIANYQPLQDPFGGPNYFFLDPATLYTIHIDNDDDGMEDITFVFQFNNFFRDLTVNSNGADTEIPLLAIGEIDEQADPNLNIIEQYTLSIYYNGIITPSVTRPVDNVTSGTSVFYKPFDNAGEKTIPNYEVYANTHIYDMSFRNEADDADVDGRVFVGQRAEPFYIDLGAVFDLVNLDPVGDENGRTNTLAGKNITSFCIEVPTSFLLGDTPSSPAVIAGWTNSYSFTPPNPNNLTQLSRLGSPLVNEVVIGLSQKDQFNASVPNNDAQFLNFVQNSSLAAILQILYPSVTAPTLTPRDDLIQIFLTGIPGLTEIPGGQPYEALRLNTAIQPTAADQQDPMGVLAGDLAGYPNGRRPADDVVDISLRAVMGVLLDAAVAPSGQLPFTDGVRLNATDYPASFPFLNTPIPGATSDDPTSMTSPGFVVD